jgi:hypothetical protein
MIARLLAASLVLTLALGGCCIAPPVAAFGSQPNAAPGRPE